MCGIFGILAPESDAEWRAELIRDLFYYTDVRGEDASGMAYFDENEELQVIKEAVKGSQFCYSDVLNDVLERHVPTTLIGHCRKGTQGSSKDNNNNHPIVSDRTGIAVVHNGGVRDAVWRATDENGGNPFILDNFTSEVDSEAIVRLIDTMLHIPRSEDGKIDPDLVANTPKDQWTEGVALEQAISETVYNLTGQNTCGLLRPGHPNSIWVWKVIRDLHFFWLPEQRAMMFASTDKIGKSALTEEYWEMNIFRKSRMPAMLEQKGVEGQLYSMEWVGGDTPVNVGLKKMNPDGADNIKKAVKGTEYTLEKDSSKENSVIVHSNA